MHSHNTHISERHPLCMIALFASLCCDRPPRTSHEPSRRTPCCGATRLWSDKGLADPRATPGIPASVVLAALSQTWRFLALPTTGTRHRFSQSVQSAVRGPQIRTSFPSVSVHGQLQSHPPRSLRRGYAALLKHLRLMTLMSLHLRALAQLKIHLTCPLTRPFRYL